MTDKTIEWLNLEQSYNADKPFFIYYAPGAVHAPHHAPKEWIDKYKGKFSMGWDKLRQETFERQKANNIIPKNTVLPPMPDFVPRWDSLTADEKRVFERQMEVYAGYLETMFAGVGGEVLYRPVDSNLAYGFDINYVKQRDPFKQLATEDYEAITGHASVYWKPEFLDGTQVSVSVGQFLAKDKGVNIDFAKRFDSGIVVGAYAAFTDVSSQEYGEGSFTKGFYISIPTDLFLLEPAKGRGLFPWVPISRDGGQMLRRPVRLIDMTEIRSPFYD